MFVREPRHRPCRGPGGRRSKVLEGGIQVSTSEAERREGGRRELRRPRENVPAHFHHEVKTDIRSESEEENMRRQARKKPTAGRAPD